MNVILMILYCTIVLGILVVIHEGGHYLASRAFGVRVTEFMLGMPGPNIGFKKWGTKFGVTPILLGGYARVCGMEPGEMSPHLEPVLAAVWGLLIFGERPGGATLLGGAAVVGGIALYIRASASPEAAEDRASAATCR